jgi:hypothetical protein
LFFLEEDGKKGRKDGRKEDKGRMAKKRRKEGSKIKEGRQRKEGRKIQKEIGRKEVEGGRGGLFCSS